MFFIRKIPGTPLLLMLSGGGKEVWGAHPLSTTCLLLLESSIYNAPSQVVHSLPFHDVVQNNLPGPWQSQAAWNMDTRAP